MWDWLKSAAAAFTGGGGQSNPNAPPAGASGGAGGGTGATGSGQSPAAAAAMQHYADGAGPGAGPPGPRFSPEMQTTYMRLLESGMTPAQAQKTLMGLAADPGGDTGAGPNAAGTARTAPGYGPTYRSK